MKKAATKITFNLYGKKVRINSLKYKSKDDQIAVMRDWFYENYEDPANACPYEGREGGYFYIYGGPYEASEVLQEMFEPYVNPKCIDELVGELNGECYEWSANSEKIDWYENDLFDAVISSANPYLKFLENIETIRSLAKVDPQGNQRNHLLSLLFTNVITALETLYVELFINSIEKNDSYIADYIAISNSQFRANKEVVAMLFKGETIQNIKDALIIKIKEHLISASWHNTDKVIKLYKDTFGINKENNWPIPEIEIATITRNDLIHRGGKDKDGKPVLISEQDLENLINNASILGEKLHESLEAVLQKDNQFEESEF